VKKSQKIRKQKKSLEDEHELRLQAEEEVRAREEFLSIASHELKNPLTSMLLQIQGILHNVKHVSLADFSVDKMMRMLESSEQQSRRLNKMISDLLNVSLITTGRMDLEMEKANLTDIVKDVAMRFTEQLERAGCEFKLIATKPIEMKVDKLRIEQVITNLLSNAIKYGKGKPIVLEVEKDNTIARITVSDKGIGIPPENLERIFNRFERAAVDRKEYKGLGVGLYIASQIVNAHKGVIKVKSKSGEGSEFIVELPIK
jgi:signal transduction histidine kinase